LLLGAILSWFALLLEKDSPLIEDLHDFLTKFNDTFGKTDSVRIATTKISLLRQGSCPALVFITDFRQLAYNDNWDNNTLISAFWWGLRGECMV
jgi:hypothetical protein